MKEETNECAIRTTESHSCRIQRFIGKNNKGDDRNLKRERVREKKIEKKEKKESSD